jgi:hypothetical protein
VLLEDKNAVIYVDRGKVGGAVARAFAREGAGSSSSVVPLRASRKWPRRSRRLEQVKTVGMRRGEPMYSKLVYSAHCTEDILIANESCGWAPSLEVEFYV